MKREFGKALIERVLSNLDLTLVVDTSQAYIPFHGTPTVLLFGRNRRPLVATVRLFSGLVVLSAVDVVEPRIEYCTPPLAPTEKNSTPLLVVALRMLVPENALVIDVLVSTEPSMPMRPTMRGTTALAVPAMAVVPVAAP